MPADFSDYELTFDDRGYCVEWQLRYIPTDSVLGAGTSRTAEDMAEDIEMLLVTGKVV